jgi:hypothetical protein
MLHLADASGAFGKRSNAAGVSAMMVPVAWIQTVVMLAWTASALPSPGAPPVRGSSG